MAVVSLLFHQVHWFLQQRRVVVKVLRIEIQTLLVLSRFWERLRHVKRHQMISSGLATIVIWVVSWKMRWRVPDLVSHLVEWEVLKLLTYWYARPLFGHLSWHTLRHINQRHLLTLIEFKLLTALSWSLVWALLARSLDRIQLEWIVLAWVYDLVVIQLFLLLALFSFVEIEDGASYGLVFEERLGVEKVERVSYCALLEVFLLLIGWEWSSGRVHALILGCLIPIISCRSVKALLFSVARPSLNPLRSFDVWESSLSFVENLLCFQVSIGMGLNIYLSWKIFLLVSRVDVGSLAWNFSVSVGFKGWAF